MPNANIIQILSPLMILNRVRYSEIIVVSNTNNTLLTRYINEWKIFPVTIFMTLCEILGNVYLYKSRIYDGTIPLHSCQEVNVVK